jgi:hypothetical protein
MHFDAITGHLLPLFFENGDHIDAGAPTEGEQKQFQRRRGAAALRISFNRLRVPGRTDAYEKIVAGEVNRRFLFGICHQSSDSRITCSFSKRRCTVPIPLCNQIVSKARATRRSSALNRTAYKHPVPLSGDFPTIFDGGMTIDFPST